MAIYYTENMNSPKKILKTGKNILISIVFALTCVLAACTGLPKAGIEVYGGLGKPSDPVPFMEKVRTGTLPSGLRYFILENQKPENRAYLTLAVKAGSVLEQEDERGLAHFVEHMAFNGTTRFPEADLLDYLRSLGMRFGAHANAYTSFDETVYGIEVPVEAGDDGIRRIPDRALAVLDDWTRAITFAPSDVDDERAIIIEEYRSRLGAMDRIQQKMLPVLFQGSPYAERLPIGLLEVIENAPAARLENFYKKWYRADNMALILAGDFDGAALENSLINHFSIPKPADPLQRPLYDLSRPKKGVETLIVTDPELPFTRISLYYKRSPEAPRNDLAYYRNEIIDILIDRMLSFRFEDEGAKPETPSVYAGAGAARYGTSSRFYVLVSQAKTGSIEASLQQLLRAKESMLRYGFTESELAIAANSLVSDIQRMVSEKDRQETGRYINYLTRYYLEGGNFADTEWELDAVQRLLPHISIKDISAVINDYFKSGDLRVFIFAPEAEQANIPSDARIRQMLKESVKMKIAPPEDSAAGEGFLSYTPEPGSVIAESLDAETGAIRWELSNGAKIILKETKNRNNEIILNAMARGGVTSAAEEDGISARLASEMLQASGLGPWSRTDLMRKLADKQVSLSFWVSSYYRGISGSATARDLKILFEMIALGFTEPKIDPQAVEAMMDQYRTSLALRLEDPEAVFSDEISRIAYGAHPRFKPLELADLSKADIERALAFIRRGLNPADYTFIFTGNLDMEALRQYAETYIASIPPVESWDQWTNLNIRRPGKTEKIVYKGKEDRSMVYMGWFAKAPFSEEAGITAQILSEYLDIRMTEEIREKLGGVYSISVNVSAQPVPEGELNMSVYFYCDPKRAEELSGAVINLLRRTAGLDNTSGGAEEAVNRDIFVKSAEALKKEWESSMQNNSYIAQSYANSAVLLNLPLSRLNRRPRYIDAVTPAGIQRLCAQLLRNGPAQVIMYPEGSAH